MIHAHLHSMIQINALNKVLSLIIKQEKTKKLIPEKIHSKVQDLNIVIDPTPDTKVSILNPLKIQILKLKKK